MDDLKYIGMDVHSATTTIAVQDSRGRLVMEATVATQAAALSDFLRGLRGRLWLTFEEGNWAAWLTQVLTPQVEKLIVCNPRRNASLKQGNKSDPLDARELAHLLQANLLKPVYHEADGAPTLQELARAYTTCVSDTTRVMNRIKARYRARGILCSGSRVYRPRFRQAWFEQLTDPGARQRVELLYAQLDLLQELRKRARQALRTEARRDPAYALLRTVPGIGPVRAALLLALLRTPFRFRTKRQLWTYAGLGLVTRDTGQYQIVGGQIIRRQRPARVRGLNPQHNRELKEIFKSAALAATRPSSLLHAFYQQRLDQGMRPHLARLTLARKIASLTLTLWKKGERFNAHALTSQAE
ncbi:MAG: hypothetical protein DMF38_14765 [Verrucomicrobia bacterium]|nr:MAG: hypothetical protein DMF38_14765 [Verrucomicrobiota bacterium]